MRVLAHSGQILHFFFFFKAIFRLNVVVSSFIFFSDYEVNPAVSREISLWKDT